MCFTDDRFLLAWLVLHAWKPYHIHCILLYECADKHRGIAYRVSMFVHTWQQHLSACTMSHANTVNIMKEWWIDPPRIWRVFSPRNTRCIDVHICECTTSEIDALWCQFRIGVFQSCGHCKSHEWVVDRSTEDLASFLASWHEVWHNTKDSSLSLSLTLSPQS